MPMPRLGLNTPGTPRYTKLDDGRWHAEVRFRSSNGKVRKLRATRDTKRKVEQAIWQSISEQVSPVSATGVTPNMPFRTLAERWWDDIEDSDLSTGTRETYSAASAQLVKALGDVRVSEFSTAVCEAYLKPIAKKHPSKAKLHRTVLLAQLGLAVRHGALSSNPIKDVGGIRKPRKKQIVAASLEELETVRRGIRQYFDAIDATGRTGRKRSRVLIPMTDVALGTGARIGEILALLWSDIDWEARTITISGRIVKGNIREPGTKGGMGSRTLPVSKFLIDSLLAHQLEAKSNPYDAVFATSKGTFYTASNIHTAWREFRKAAGLPSDLTFHSIRKTVATLIAAATDGRTAAYQLGHSQESMTYRHYIEDPIVVPDSSATLETAFGKSLENAPKTPFTLESGANEKARHSGF